MASLNLTDLLKSLETPTYVGGTAQTTPAIRSVGGGTGGGGGASWGGGMPTYGPVQPAPQPAVAPVSNTTTSAAPGATREPTIAETLANIKQQALGLQSELDASNVTGLTQPKNKFSTGTSALSKEGYFPEEVDAEAEYKRLLKLHQAEIDATNMVYDQLLNESRMQGEGRLGTGRAIAARGGLLGSDFAEGQREKINQYNTDIYRGIGAERQAKIGAILGKVRDSAAAAVTEKRLARQQGADNYLKYLAASQERKTNNVSQIAQELIDQGFDPATMEPGELDAIATQAGLSTDEIISGYTTRKKQVEAEEAAALAKEDFTLSEGQARYDAQGNLIAEKKKTYAPKATGGGSAGGATGKYGSDVDALVGTAGVLIGPENQREAFNSAIAKSRSNQEKMSVVASMMLSKQSADVRNDFTNLKSSANQLDKAIAQIDSGVQTGVLENVAQTAANFFGKDFNSELTKLRSNVIAATQPYRNSVTGAAWGTQEEAEYQALTGSNKYYPEELRTRLENFKSIIESKQANILGAFIDPIGIYDDTLKENYGSVTSGSATYDPTGDPEYDEYLRLIGPQ